MASAAPGTAPRTTSSTCWDSSHGTKQANGASDAQVGNLYRNNPPFPDSVHEGDDGTGDTGPQSSYRRGYSSGPDPRESPHSSAAAATAAAAAATARRDSFHVHGPRFQASRPDDDHAAAATVAAAAVVILWTRWAFTAPAVRAHGIRIQPERQSRSLRDVTAVVARVFWLFLAARE
jgi:hypothetical protein